MAYIPVATSIATTASTTSTDDTNPCSICRAYNNINPPNIYMSVEVVSHRIHRFFDFKNPEVWLNVTLERTNHRFELPHAFGNSAVRHHTLLNEGEPARIVKKWLQSHAMVEPTPVGKVDTSEPDYYRDSHNMLKDIIHKLQDDVTVQKEQVAAQSRLVESLQQEKAALHSQVQMLMQLLLHKSQSE